MQTPLNVKAQDFCKIIGITYNSDILRCLREENLVRFFKVGNKYYYPTEDAQTISNKLIKGNISIKVNGGYYVTINN